MSPILPIYLVSLVLNTNIILPAIDSSLNNLSLEENCLILDGLTFQNKKKLPSLKKLSRL